MSRTLKSQWPHLKREVWHKLERRKNAKMEMYIELYRFIASELKLEEEVGAYSDPGLARELFRAISPDEIMTERKCITLIEGFYKVLRDEFSHELGQNYLEVLDYFLKQRNLRYKVADKGKLILTISGLLADEYDSLRQTVSDCIGINAVLGELEDIIPDLHKQNKTSAHIRVVSLLLEASAIQRAGGGRTLGEAVSQLARGDCFPHRALAQSLEKLHGFFSDYPNIRHGGNPEGKLRDLKCDDALLLIALAIAYSAFLCNDLDIDAILTG